MELLYRNYHKIVASQVLFTHGNLSENRGTPKFDGWSSFFRPMIVRECFKFSGKPKSYCWFCESVCLSYIYIYIYIQHIYNIYIYIKYIYNISIYIYIYIISPWSPHFCCLKLCCLLHPLALGLRNDFVEADGFSAGGRSGRNNSHHQQVGQWVTRFGKET